jgi:hypothetical protein
LTATASTANGRARGALDQARDMGHHRADMLTSLHVAGFRDLADMAVERLARVNLFVGTNNSGKTSLLEAAEILLSEGSLRSVLAGPLRRGEVVGSETARNNREVEVRHLFHGHRLTENTEFSIRGENGGPQRVIASLEPNDSSRSGFQDEEEGFVSDEDDLPQPGSHLELYLGKGDDESDSGFQMPLNASGRIPLYDPEVRSHIASERDTGFNFVTTSGFNARQIGQMWDEVVLTAEEKTVMQALQIIEPGIDRLAFVGRETTTSCLIKLRDRDEPVPLGSMGEGIRRVLALAVGLARARRHTKLRYLLVDEIDTGLHHSVMTGVWRMVVAVARRLDLQVFATTHSLDCLHALASLYEADASIRDEVLLHRIEKGCDRTTVYTADELPVIREHRMEVRG